MLTYYKLFDYINRKDINKSELRAGAKLSNGTMNRLVHNEIIQTDAIDRICEYLNCQPGQIMEYEPHNSKKNNPKLDIVWKGTHMTRLFISTD